MTFSYWVLLTVFAVALAQPKVRRTLQKEIAACVPRNSGALEVMISALSCGNASMHASEACL